MELLLDIWKQVNDLVLPEIRDRKTFDGDLQVPDCSISIEDKFPENTQTRDFRILRDLPVVLYVEKLGPKDDAELWHDVVPRESQTPGEIIEGFVRAVHLGLLLKAPEESSVRRSLLTFIDDAYAIAHSAKKRRLDYFNIIGYTFFGVKDRLYCQDILPVMHCIDRYLQHRHEPDASYDSRTPVLLAGLDSEVRLLIKK